MIVRACTSGKLLCGLIILSRVCECHPFIYIVYQYETILICSYCILISHAGGYEDRSGICNSTPDEGFVYCYHRTQQLRICG